MTPNFRIVAALIEAHPNRQVPGRARLQRTVCLLQHAGMPTDYKFSIQFRGPYSEELRADLSVIQSLGLGCEEVHVGENGDEFFVVKATTEAKSPTVDRFREMIQTLAKADSTVLELAATYDTLRGMRSDHADAIRRLRSKKGTKCDGGRLEAALGLVQSLDRSTTGIALKAAN
jgi:uncharacterized protein YwgA